MKIIKKLSVRLFINMLLISALTLFVLHNYAFAQTTDDLQTSGSGWVNKGSYVILQNPAASIGVGLTIPNYKVDIAGSLHAVGASLFDSTGVFKSLLTAGNGFKLTTGPLNLFSTSGSVNINLDHSTSAFNINKPLLTIDTFNNRVGIGKTYPFTSTLDVNGTIGANKININYPSAGTGVISAGQTSVIIRTAAVTASSLIFTTPKTKIPFPLAVTSQVAGNYFTVEIPSAQSSNINFNWWLIN